LSSFYFVPKCVFSAYPIGIEKVIVYIKMLFFSFIEITLLVIGFIGFKLLIAEQKGFYSNVYLTLVWS